MGMGGCNMGAVGEELGMVVLWWCHGQVQWTSRARCGVGIGFAPWRELVRLLFRQYCALGVG